MLIKQTSLKRLNRVVLMDVPETRLNVPSLNDPALPIHALALRRGMVPPADGGQAVGDYLERGLELPAAAERWREVCYAAAVSAAAAGAAGAA